MKVKHSAGVAALEAEATPVEGAAPPTSDARMRPPSFGTLLVLGGFATDEQVRVAAAEGLETGERIGEVVIRKGWATEEQVAEVLAEQWQLPFLASDAVVVDPAALERVPFVVARSLRVLPVGFDGERLVLAISDPSHDLFAEVEKTVGPASYVIVARTVLQPLLDDVEVTEEVHEEMEAAVDDSHEDWADEHGNEVPYLAPEGGAVALADAGEAYEVEPEGLAAVETPSALSGVESVVSSIDAAAGELERIRSEVAVLGGSLAMAREQIASQKGELEAAQRKHERDGETIRGLEAELSRRTDLFDSLKAQVGSLAELVGAGASN